MARIFYSRNADFIEVTVRNHTGQKLEHFKCASNNKTAYNKILFVLKDKYGFQPEIKKFSKAKQKASEIEEVDFLDMNNSWFS